MKKAKHMWLFTNRNCLVFDEDGEQIVEYQKAISCYALNKKLALQATLEASEFHIGRWREWEHEIPRESMQYLLGLRTREMDSANPPTDDAPPELYRANQKEKWHP